MSRHVTITTVSFPSRPLRRPYRFPSPLVAFHPTTTPLFLAWTVAITVTSQFTADHRHSRCSLAPPRMPSLPPSTILSPVCFPSRRRLLPAAFSPASFLRPPSRPRPALQPKTPRTRQDPLAIAPTRWRINDLAHKTDAHDDTCKYPPTTTPRPSTRCTTPALSPHQTTTAPLSIGNTAERTIPPSRRWGAAPRGTSFDSFSYHSLTNRLPAALWTRNQYPSHRPIHSWGPVSHSTAPHIQ
ncbi:hypothetical protein C8R43DRAFT_1126650 [Mycena crocata]|nr:hypothetical protein C8R43DRAFT_1126650 [Mycena crocata]